MKGGTERGASFRVKKSQHGGRCVKRVARTRLSLKNKLKKKTLHYGPDVNLHVFFFAGSKGKRGLE